MNRPGPCGQMPPAPTFLNHGSFPQRPTLQLHLDFGCSVSQSGTESMGSKIKTNDVVIRLISMGKSTLEGFLWLS